MNMGIGPIKRQFLNVEHCRDDMLLAEKRGVYKMFGTFCCTFIPNNTSPDGSITKRDSHHSLQSWQRTQGSTTPSLTCWRSGLVSVCYHSQWQLCGSLRPAQLNIPSCFLLEKFAAHLRCWNMLFFFSFASFFWDCTVDRILWKSKIENSAALWKGQWQEERFSSR